jgi:hypothetical protein
VVLGNQDRSALIGFAIGALASEHAQRFFENLLDITNAPPFIHPLEVQPNSYVAAVSTPVSVTVRSTDRNGDMCSEELHWDDNGRVSINDMDSNTGEHVQTFTHTYAAAGLYQLAADVSEYNHGKGARRPAPRLMAVYDAADSAKGSGWFESPAGADQAEASTAGGKATFGGCAAPPAGREPPRDATAHCCTRRPTRAPLDLTRQPTEPLKRPRSGSRQLPKGRLTASRRGQVQAPVRSVGNRSGPAGCSFAAQGARRCRNAPPFRRGRS